jgi:hypothetical protein
MFCTAFLVHPYAFWAPNLHRLYGSAVSLLQFHRVTYVKFVENTMITLKLRTDNFHQFCCYLYQQGHHSQWMGSHCDLHHARLAIFEFPNPLLHFPLIHYTWHINATILPMKFSCSKILLHSKNISLQDFKTGGIFD